MCMIWASGIIFAKHFSTNSGTLHRIQSAENSETDYIPLVRSQNPGHVREVETCLLTLRVGPMMSYHSFPKLSPPRYK
jgi:hypothetical protein